MNSQFLYLLAVIMGAILVYLFINIIRTKEKDISTNEAFVEIFDIEHSDEGAWGIAEKIEWGEDRVKVIFSSRDRNMLKDLKDTNNIKKLIGNNNFQVEIKSKTLFFDRKLFIEKGNSNNKKSYWAFPQKINRLPESMRNNKQIGKMMSEIINNANIERDTEDLNKTRLESMEKIASQTYGGKVFTGLLAEYNGILKTALENVKSSVEKKEEK